MRFLKEDNLEETKTARTYSHIVNDDNFAIISPYRSENSNSTNKSNLLSLKSDIRKLGLGYNELVARWVEYDTEEERNISSDERSLFIHGISKNDAMRLGKKYHQSSVIIKDNNSCEEICTTPFPYEDNGSVKEFNIGDVVRTYNISGDKVLNIEDAKEIFANKKSGPSSKSVKGNTPFTFTPKDENLVLEVWDVESPRAAYFHTPNDERYLRVF